MRNNLQVPLTVSLLALAGCATTNSNTQQSPLLFISTNSFGVDVGASPSSASLPSINLGFKSLDVALVPVTTDVTNVAIRGCYNAGQNVGKVGNCDAVIAASEGRQPSSSAGAPARVAETSTPPEGPIRIAQAAPLKAEEVRVQAVPLAPGAAPLRTLHAPVTKAPPVGASAVPVVIGPNPGSFDQSMRDSLSVFSSFNADTKVGQEASIQLGKAFATGVAAQQLTEGLNYYMQLKGQSLIGADSNKEIALRSECMQAVIEAKDKSAPEASLPNCGERGLSMEGLRVRIACAQVLKSAVEKKIPAAQLPKCSG